MVSYSMAGLNPFRTLPKDGTSRAAKDMQNRSASGTGFDGGQGANFRGNFRGRGGGFNQPRGNMHAGQANFNRNNFAAGGGAGNMGGGYNNQMFNNPMGAGGNFGFNRGGMMNMGGMPRGGGNMRGGRGGMGGNMMGMNPMGGGMPNPMAGMGMMGGGMQGTYDVRSVSGYTSRDASFRFGIPFQRYGPMASQQHSHGQPPPYHTLYMREAPSSGAFRPEGTSQATTQSRRSLRNNNNVGPLPLLRPAHTNPHISNTRQPL